MEAFAALMEGTWNLMNTPFSLFGFEFSFWGVMAFSAVVSIVGYLFGELLGGDY